jgi:hypothetical protein
VDAARFKLLTLQITQQFPKGLSAKILCKGAKCPFKTKSLKLGKVRRGARNAISSLNSKQRRFRAGQTIEVWVSAPGFNTTIARLALKANRVPTTQPFLRPPGPAKAQKSCG